MWEARADAPLQCASLRAPSGCACEDRYRTHSATPQPTRLDLCLTREYATRVGSPYVCVKATSLFPGIPLHDSHSCTTTYVLPATLRRASPAARVLLQVSCLFFRGLAGPRITGVMPRLRGS
jgi:hypothetical protein